MKRISTEKTVNNEKTISNENTEKTNKGSKGDDDYEVGVNPERLRTIYENYNDNYVWYSKYPVPIEDSVIWVQFWRRWWMFPFEQVPTAVSHLNKNPSSSIFLLVVFIMFMWILVGFVASISFVVEKFLSFLSAFPFLEFLDPGSAVNWGTVSDLEDWKLTYGDLTSSKWDLKNAEFFIHLCALSYENPQSALFKNITESWGIKFTRTAARESAQCHVWSFTKEGEGFVVLCFKGTSPFNWNEWLTDATVSPVCAPKLSPNKKVTVHQGFYEALWGRDSHHWEHIVHQLNAAIREIPTESINCIHVWVTGHSLGAATGTLATYRLLLHKEDIDGVADKRVKLCGSYTFGTPRVGNSALIDEVCAAADQEEDFTMHRVINGNDIITMIPFQDSAGTYVFYGDAHYVSLKGGLVNRPYKDDSSKYDPWLFFLRVRGINIIYTIEEWFKTLITLPLHIWTVKDLYNSLSRLIIPYFLFDHFPSQYIEHLEEVTDSSTSTV